jgi:hypothetical protein
MAIIPQRSLFSWKDVEELGDLERLKVVLETMPDEELVRQMEKDRFRGRNDYPVRAIWNSILAGIVYQHPSIASLRRELLRNGQLRDLCGFDPLTGVEAVPSESAYSRFSKKLMTKYYHLVEDMFSRLVGMVKALLPDFGETLVIDGKAISGLARGKNKGKPDGRRDTDANFGKSVYKGKNKDGSLWQKVKSWFGYRLHLIIDGKYELPVHFNLTKASNSEVIQAHSMVDELASLQPEIIKDCRWFLGDRGYDDKKLIVKLWDDYRIKPVIDIRNMWREQEARPLGDRANICYDFRGTMYCYCPETAVEREMSFGGFEKDRETLKYRCPAQHFGITCKGQKTCSAAKGIRVGIKENRRLFTPLARSSYAWRKKYKERTSVERVNSRLDGFFGFENHTIRGKKKMKTMCALALCVMLAMAVGRIRQKRPDLMRRLVLTA